MNKILFSTLFLINIIYSQNSFCKTDKITTLDSGQFHNCVTFQSGKVKCWGENIFGQLGILDDNGRGSEKNSIKSLPFVQLPKSDKVISIATGPTSSCGLLKNNIIKCWGENTMGMLGQGNDFPRGIHPLSMGKNLPKTDLGDNFKIEKIGVGLNHGCALSVNGKVKCWGQNAYGQLGIESTLIVGYFSDQMGNNIESINFGINKSDLKVTQLAVGYVHNCVIFENQKAKCWGNNEKGELGLGDTKERGSTKNTMGVNLPFLSFNKKYSSETMKFKSITAGYSHTCAIVDIPSSKEFDKLFCWGANMLGQLGSGHSNNIGNSKESLLEFKPINTHTTAKPTKVITAILHTCALFDNHKVKCWGRNDEGMLGIGTSKDMGELPEDMSKISFANLGKYPVVDISGKGAFTCAMLDVRGTNKIKCWGLDAEGVLGLERGDNDISIGIKPGQMGENLPFIKL